MPRIKCRKARKNYSQEDVTVFVQAVNRSARPIYSEKDYYLHAEKIHTTLPANSEGE